MEKTVEEFGEPPVEQPVAAGQPQPEDGGDGPSGEKGKQGGKKRAGGALPGPSPSKRKVGAAKIVEVASVGLESKLLHCPVVNTRSPGLYIHIKLQNKIYVMNTGSAEVTLKRGLVLAGFGKGKFKLRDGEDPDTDKEILYDLTGPDQLVLMNGQLLELKTVLAEHRKSVPKLALNYFRLEASPEAGKPDNFSLTREHSVYFVPAGNAKVVLDAEEEGGEGGEDGGKGPAAMQGHVAALVPAKVWDTHCTRVIYAVKWAASGLMPVRPQVVLTADCTLAPGRAVQLF